MASGTDLSDLENHDFYALLDGKTLIRFNNKGVSNQKVTLYRQIGEKISMLGAPPYYYSSIIRGYLHRFETITSENCKIR